MNRKLKAWTLFLLTRLVGLGVDAGALALAYVGAFVLRFDFHTPRWGWRAVALSFITVCAVHLVSLVVCGCYRIAWRRFSFKDLPRYVLAMMFSCVVLTVLRLLMPVESFSHIRPPYSVTLMTFVFATIGVIGWRIVWSWYVASKVRLDALLERGVRQMDASAATDFIRGKTVMITGAGGSIGSELVRQVAAAKPKLMLLVERGENALYEIDRELHEAGVESESFKSLMVDINDLSRMNEIFAAHRPDVVLHAAAYKHVPMVEMNPVEGERNNTEATRNLAEMAKRYAVARFVMISTDKAVNPVSVMGKTKLAAEKAIMALNSPDSPTSFCAVRFGNVLGSSGSVVPLFKQQIAAHRPVTVTHPEMKRYFMTVREAVGLVLQAASRSEKAIYTLDMGKPVKIIDLAEQMIRQAGYRPYVDIPIVFTGIRPGEKLFEELDISEKSAYRTDMARIFINYSLTVCAAFFTFALSAAGDIDRKVDELMAKMTLDEKLGQLNQVQGIDRNVNIAAEDLSQQKSNQEFLRRLAKGDFGSLIGCRGVENFNALQKVALKSRLKIPLLIGHDMIHGAITDYPTPLAISSSWDTNLWFRCARAIGPETWLKGANWTFAPMLDIARDARWGRIVESPGQDPYLGYLYGYWWTKGLQGEDMSKDYHIAACGKHFVGYGAAEGGRDYNSVEMSESTLRNVYLAPFRGAIAAGVATMMPGFHTFNDVPCSINRYLLTDVLRDEIGFKGFTISDWDAVWETRSGCHGCGSNAVDICTMAINAGMDMEMNSNTYRLGLKKAIESGEVKESTVDAAVRRILKVKFELGLFDHPLIDEEDLRKHIDFKANRQLAREAAQKSVVILKNDKGLLPLKPSVRIALLGALGHDTNIVHGAWSTRDNRNLENATLLEGLRADGFKVAFSPCLDCDLDSKVDLAALREAIAACDVAIVCLGERNRLNGENSSRSDIALPGEQMEAVRLLKDLGKPFVVVLFNGRPLAIPELAKSCDTIVEAWNPGGAGGWGVADVICGVAEPWGRLTVDFPETSGMCPRYYNRLKTGRSLPDDYEDGAVQDVRLFGRTKYLDASPVSVFPFGYGLAYTTFAYTNEQVKVDGGKVRFSVEVTNTGKRVGYEVVQLYIRDKVARISRPRRELKRFERIRLEPGEKKVVEFVLNSNDLGYWCFKDWVVEHGRFCAWIAPDSNSGRLLQFDF